MRCATLVLATLSLVPLAGAVLLAEPAAPRDICPPAILREPSGVAFHPTRGTLFAVGDEGDLAEITTAGAKVKSTHLGDFDLEGITVGPSGKLLIAIECRRDLEGAPPALLVVDPETQAIERTLIADPLLDGTRVLALKPNDGIEGICWVEGRGLFAVNQIAPARLVELDLPATGERVTVKRIVAELAASVPCASDLGWDAASGHFLIISSSQKERSGKLYELDADGKVLRDYPMPGERQEGYCRDAAGNAYVACDSGGILRCAPPDEGANSGK
ncbi:MAG: SdiA-regulated domain-containing protein [Planctomycetes bacterium]|nr:SdiA-regulated domain-containing protein [Planctomycetota bacterium]